MSIFSAIIWTLLILIGIPYIAYVVVKVGTLGFLQAQNEYKKDKEKRNGDQK